MERRVRTADQLRRTDAAAALQGGIWEIESSQNTFTDGQGNKYWLIDTTGGAVSVALPAAADVSPDTIFNVKRTTGGANALTVTPDSGNIDGSAAHSIATQYAAFGYASDGTNYHIVRQYSPGEFVTSASLATALGSYLTSNSASIGYARLSVSNTFTDNQVIQSSDAGAAAGPIVNFDRNSASPAVNDILGQIRFSGRDDAAGTQIYSFITSAITDATSGNPDGQLILGTLVAGSATTKIRIGAGTFTNNATSGDMGADTINASEYYKNGLIATRTLIASLTTTSGTTHSVTSIPAYRELYIEIQSVSFTASATLTMAVSDDNGANYGTARNVSVASGSAGGIIVGTITVSNMQSSTWATALSITATAPTATMTQLAVAMAEAGGGGANINAIQFAGGTFDGGIIRVYGLL